MSKTDDLGKKVLKYSEINWLKKIFLDIIVIIKNNKIKINFIY